MAKKGESFKIDSEQVNSSSAQQVKPKRFVIIPGFLCDHSDEKSVELYLGLIKSKLFVYENENKFDVSFLVEKDHGEIKSILKSIEDPFIVLLLRDVSVNDFMVFEKFARKNKRCKVYYEGRKENLSYYEEEEMEIKNERISINNIHNYEERLELFIMMTKKELDALANSSSKIEEN